MKTDRICLGVLSDNTTIKFAAEELEKYLRLIDDELWIDVLEFKLYFGKEEKQTLYIWSSALNA